MRVIVVLICMLLPFAGRSQAFVKSSDGNFEWRLIGRVLMDAGFFRGDSTKLGNGAALINHLVLGFFVRVTEMGGQSDVNHLFFFIKANAW